MKAILDKICDLNQICEQVYGQTFKVDVVMNKRLKTTAGRAIIGADFLRIEFNPTLYAQEGQVFIDRTVVHEFAHIVACVLMKSTGHDAHWRSVMQTLGAIDSKRCHSYAVQSTKAKTTTYTCGCSNYEITPQRKSWMTRGKVYRCVKCNNIIKEGCK
jgi:SprT protein